jgi:RND family efflux transporter MFP subunit
MSFSKFFLLSLSLMWLAGCGGPPEHAPKAAEKAPAAAATITIAPVEWADTFEALGTVRARTAATVSSRVMGYVQDVRAREGDHVSAGQTLVVIEARDLETGQRQAQARLEEARNAMPETDGAIASAEAQLELAQTTLRRMQDLLEKRSVSQQEFDEAAARVKVAQAGFEMAQAKKRQLAEKIRQADQAVEHASIQRGYAEVKAPFAGRVTARRVEPGTLAAPGVPLLEIEQEGSFRLEASVEESRLSSVQRGQVTRIRLDAVDAPLQGRVGEIVPVVEESSRAFTVKIDLPPNPALRGGLFGRAEFAAGKRQVVAVPQAAIATEGQVRSVMVADSGLARSRLVTLGATRGDLIEVLSGLRAGDRVIHPRPAGLADGGRVEVR